MRARLPPARAASMASARFRRAAAVSVGISGIGGTVQLVARFTVSLGLGGPGKRLRRVTRVWTHRLEASPGPQALDPDLLGTALCQKAT